MNNKKADVQLKSLIFNLVQPQTVENNFNSNDQNNPVSNLRWAYNTMKHLQFLRIYLQVLFTNYEPTPTLLKSTSPEGEV